MPIALGPGVPARASWACMDCFSSVLTVSQSSFNSLAMSLIVASRQRRPTGEALGVEGIVRQEVELLALHGTATPAPDAPDFDLQEDARVAARQIANPPYAPVVPTRMNSPTAPADRFFERRARLMIRAFGSPNTPRTVGCGRNPGNAYASQRRRSLLADLAIPSRCQNPAPRDTRETQQPCAFRRRLRAQTTHTTSRRPFKAHQGIEWVIWGCFRVPAACMEALSGGDIPGRAGRRRDAGGRESCC